MVDVNALYKQANDCYNAGEYVKAVDLYDQVIPKVTDDHKGLLHYYKGVCLVNCEGKEAEAIGSFNEALKFDLKDQKANVLGGIGRALQKQNKMDEAVDFYEKALKEDPSGTSISYVTLTQVLNQSEKFDKALAVAAEGLKHQKDKFDELHTARIVAFCRMGKNTEALEDVEKILEKKQLGELKPQQIQLFSELFLEKGQDLMNNNPGNAAALEEARKYFERAYDGAGTATSAFLLGMANLRQKHLDEALKWFSKASEIDGNYWKALLAAGMVCMQKGKESFPQAITFFDKALLASKEADNASLHFNKGFAHYDLGQTDAAKRSFEKVYVADPENWKNAAILGTIVLNEKDYEKAVEYLLHAIEYSKGQADDNVHYNLAYAYMMLNKFKEAQKYFDKAAEINPNNEAAKKAALDMKREAEEEEKRIKEEEERQRKEEEARIAKEKEAERLRKEAILKEEQAKKERDAKVRAEKEKQAAEEKRKAQQALEEAEKAKEEEKRKIEIKKQEARERRRKRMEELQVKVGGPQAYRARRPSLDLIPKGNTEKNATSYADWFNTNIVHKS